MARPETPKPATARDTRKPASKVEQLGGQLYPENNLSTSIAQPETALAAAFREAARRKAVAS